jgi:RNase P/RNase MRP subunit POP5
MSVGIRTEASQLSVLRKTAAVATEAVQMLKHFTVRPLQLTVLQISGTSRRHTRRLLYVESTGLVI